MNAFENYDLKDGKMGDQPNSGRTLRMANAMSCAKELYEMGDMTEEAYKAMLVHFIEISGYELISRDF